MTTDDESEIAREILAYLSDHPQANDTLEGIIEWWLLERKIRNQSAAVKEALEGLIEKGLVEVSFGSDSRMKYKVKS